MKVKEFIARFFKKQNISHIFGHTGFAVTSLIDELIKEDFEIVYSRSENNSVYLADGYSRILEKPAIIITTTGPGATNLVTGVANAYSDSIPLLLVCALNDSISYGLNNHQDGTGRGRSIDQNNIFSNCCKESIFVANPKTIITALREAFRMACSGRKGPVYLGIPRDFWDIEIENDSYFDKEKNNYAKNLKFVKNDSFKKVFDLIYKSKKPLFIIGEGIKYDGVGIDFNKFIQKIRVPYVISPMTKDYVDEFNECYLGTLRHTGSKQIFEYLKEADLLVILGDRLSSHEYGNNLSYFKNKIIVQIDNDPCEIGKLFSVDVAIESDFKEFFNNDLIKLHNNSSALINEIHQLSEKYINIIQPLETKLGINSFYIPKLLEKIGGSDAVFTVDGGSAKTLFITKLRTKITQRFLVADKFSPMGYSIPASIGASIAGKKEVYCLVGDASFQMTFNDLAVLIGRNIKIILLLLNNGGMKTIKNYCEVKKLPKFCNPDFKHIALSMDMEYQFAKKYKNLEIAIKKAKISRKSQFIEVIIDQSILRLDVVNSGKIGKIKPLIKGFFGKTM